MSDIFAIIRLARWLCKRAPKSLLLGPPRSKRASRRRWSRMAHFHRRSSCPVRHSYSPRSCEPAQAASLVAHHWWPPISAGRPLACQPLERPNTNGRTGEHQQYDHDCAPLRAIFFPPSRRPRSIVRQRAQIEAPPNALPSAFLLQFRRQL